MPLKIPDKISPELSEFVGILLGDGCVGIYNCKSKEGVKKQYRVKITLNSQDDILYKNYIIQLIEKIFNVAPIVRKRSNENTVDILIFSKNLVDYLINDLGLMLSPKKYRAVVPNEIYNTWLRKYTLRGYFDTDGCVVLMKNGKNRFYPRLEMKISPSPMQSQIIEMLSKEKINFVLHPKRHGDELIKVQINGIEQTKKWLDLIGSSNPKHLGKIEKAGIGCNKNAFK